MRNRIIAAASLAMALAVSGCSISEQRRAQQRELLVHRIADDAIAYNEAYSNAIAGQILLNILRAYNRQPRQYMSMSGFNDDAGSQTRAVSIGGLPLGRIGQDWGTGGVEMSAETELAPSYTVEPFAAGTFRTLVLQPTSDQVFLRYWDAGWNPDLLLLLTVEQMEIAPLAGGEARVLRNNAGTIAHDCRGDEYAGGGCAFVRAARALAEAARTLPRIAAPEGAEGLCAPMAVYQNQSGAPFALSPARAGFCRTEMIVGDQRYTLSLRSLDDMVFYVGELLRQDADAAGAATDGVLVSRLSVIAPSSRSEYAPLFKIVPATRQTTRDYAATVAFAGQRYSAGAPEPVFCFRPGDEASCAEVTRRTDRSGTVLEFLVGILAHNQSETAVAAPQSALVTRR